MYMCVCRMEQKGMDIHTVLEPQSINVYHDFPLFIPPAALHSLPQTECDFLRGSDLFHVYVCVHL